MASTLHTLRIGARRCSQHSRSFRQFSTSLTRCEDFNIAHPGAEARISEERREGGPEKITELPPIREIRVDKFKPGFMNMGEKPGETEDDPEFENDDVSSLAHGDLEQHREHREYARLAAWEMPLLTKMAKEFEPPTMKQVLRFRYTTYMGEQHHGEKKVVLEFSPEDMPNLTDIQRMKLKKLVGVRYNPEKDIIKMSSEMFETPAQNKRYLGDLVDTLLREARDPKDTFEDVPLDTRHHPIKVKPQFPIAWRNPRSQHSDPTGKVARKTAIEAYRQEALRIDEQKRVDGKLLDGVKLIEAAMKNPARLREAVPEMVTAAAGKGKGGKRLSVRR